MENQEQEQFVPQTEGQLTDSIKVTEISPFLPDHLLRPLAPEVLTNPQEAQSVVLEELQRRRVQPPAPHDGSRLGWAGYLRTAAPEGQEFPYDAFYQNGRMHFRADTPATDAKAEVVDDETATEACAEAAAEQAPNDEPNPVQKKGKGRRNQKKRQAPPQVGQWLNANFERKTERGIIVRKGKARFHVDFRDMALAEDGTAIRFQDGDKVRVRVLSMDRNGGLPQASMLGKMLAPAPVNRPATEAPAEADPVD